MAVVQASSVVSAVSFYLTLLTVVPIGLLWAPQDARKDKRVIAAVVVVVVSLIGVPLLAFDSTICKWAWWAIECWLF